MVKPILIEEYCPRLASEAVQRRLARYREIDRDNPSRRIIAEYYGQQGRRKPQWSFALENMCAGRQAPDPLRAALR